MSDSLPICVVGSGYVGLVAAACFAEIGHHVVCVDSDESRIETLRHGGLPIFEAGLSELLAHHREKRVAFTTDLHRGVERSLAVFIAVGTPQGDGGAADLSYVESVVSGIARSIRSYKVIVEKSTVPVYTSDRIRRVLFRHGLQSDDFDVVSNPEFLREGSAIADFLHPDRIVVGVPNERAASILRRVYAPLTSGEYYDRAYAFPGKCSGACPAKLLVTSPQSAELIKHSSNAFLALKISFINAVADLAERVDADVDEIATAMGLDHRIGSAFLHAGLGYGGSCFPKDLAAFNWVAQQEGLNFRLFQEIRNINEAQKDNFLKKVLSALWTLRGKRLAALGLAFKGGTDDVRESPAIEIVQKLLDGGALVAAYDPAASENARKLLPEAQNLRYAVDVYDAARGADAILILTDWKEFGEIDLERLKEHARFPIVIDGRNVYPVEQMRQNGFTYYSVGRPPGYPIEEKQFAA